ncbi:phosphoadenosine phosphosulfate reductase family protein [Desulfobulbus sp.]|uniref:phosphoadenosine phosphosulfate reductase family protein n=1 Tax=Desulfobulbus sp. TaxID=895 RepID=UPI00286FA080|nr:phosphoadenosine phosphosulfate reductase family protein [Desulfobulbus sp.]
MDASTLQSFCGGVCDVEQMWSIKRAPFGTREKKRHSMLLDAAGNVPAPLTSFERRLAEKTANDGMKRAMEALSDKQALPLEEKIALSLELIHDWYKAWNGKVSVSYSGGKDSSVLLWLVRQVYPHVPAVFGHTGLEYPEVVRLVLDTPNHVILRPSMRFSEVIRRYGWPLASKKIARGVNIVRHPTDRNQNITRLYLEGINRYGIPVHGYKIAQQWRFLFDAPFEVSDKCCAVMKKDPMAAYERSSGNRPFVGTMASDSKQRQRTYLQHGCNAYDMKRPRSAPLSFWTEQDVLHCIQKYGIRIPSVYGEIVRTQDGFFSTAGVSRTGCLFCCFGLSLDGQQGASNRFELLAESHPKLHQFVMDRLGLREVLLWCRENAPARLTKTFRCGGELFDNDTGDDVMQRATSKESKRKYWPEQHLKAWFVVVVDGNKIGVIQDGMGFSREKNRLSGLKGIELLPATDTDLVRFSAKTKLSSRIVSVMRKRAAITFPDNPTV